MTNLRIFRWAGFPSPAAGLVAGRRGRCLRPVSILLALAVTLLPAGASSNSASYKFEGNKALALDLAVDDVRLDAIKFEWPATLMRIKTGYKATVKVANGSSRQAGIGIAIALYDQDHKLVGVGTGGTTLGTIDPGDSAQISVDFSHVTERVEQTATFQIALETR